MTKPTPKQVTVIREVLEDAVRQKAFSTSSSGPLVSLLFPGSSKIPKSMTDLRIELEQRGFIMFYSNIIVKGEEVLSINISKI